MNPSKPLGICLRPEYDAHALDRLAGYAQQAEARGFGPHVGDHRLRDVRRDDGARLRKLRFLPRLVGGAIDFI